MNLLWCNQVALIPRLSAAIPPKQNPPNLSNHFAKQKNTQKVPNPEDWGLLLGVGSRRGAGGCSLAAVCWLLLLQNVNSGARQLQKLCLMGSLLPGMWRLLRPVIESVSPALACRFFIPLSHQGSLMYKLYTGRIFSFGAGVDT